MKTETNRTATTRRLIEEDDVGLSQENTIDLSLLSVALSARNRRMKPETNKTATTRRLINNNKRSLNHAVDAVDALKDNTINLSLLSAALSARSGRMKPKTNRTATTGRLIDDDVGLSPFNLGPLSHPVDAAKENTINLSLLTAALSARSRRMKRIKGNQKKRLMIGEKPETDGELLRLSLKQPLTTKECNNKAYKAARETLICQFNTDFTMHHCPEAFLHRFHDASLP